MQSAERRDHESPVPTLCGAVHRCRAATACVGRLFLRFGGQVLAGKSAPAVATCAKLLKTSEVRVCVQDVLHILSLSLPFFCIGLNDYAHVLRCFPSTHNTQVSLRVSALGALRDIVAGLGEAGADRHSECLKLVLKTATVRVVGCCVALCCVRFRIGVVVLLFFPCDNASLVHGPFPSHLCLHHSRQDKNENVRAAAAPVVSCLVTHSRALSSVSAATLLQSCVKVCVYVYCANVVYFISPAHPR